MAPDPDVTLKEFMDLRFRGLEEKVDNLETKIEALENCLSNDVKHAINDIRYIIKLWKYIGSLIVGILLALAAAWLKQRLGL